MLGLVMQKNIKMVNVQTWYYSQNTKALKQSKLKNKIKYAKMQKKLTTKTQVNSIQPNNIKTTIRIRDLGMTNLGI